MLRNYVADGLVRSAVKKVGEGNRLDASNTMDNYGPTAHILLRPQLEQMDVHPSIRLVLLEQLSDVLGEKSNPKTKFINIPLSLQFYCSF